ncbi:MAG TPA: Crp/Fnr family transcriptional regulator [Eubacteriales bacterium]|jgi:CRP-like cAMP-binding protein|nr:Crp/Fnr family transcriptional regulator [Clostridia bacterium]HRR89849.1 Crp/Fnr family transcriptional regulator [Eubacteriales bacterium]HRU84843.1 Crp/Fnr family transcriptional regulator [Eubacteriales bacterium]
MKSFLAVLEKVGIMRGLSGEEILKLLSCMSAEKKIFEKNTLILSEGSPITKLGIVLDGELHLSITDYFGRENIIAKLTEGDLFGESAAYSEEGRAPFDIIAAKESNVITFAAKKLIAPCAECCSYHKSIINNLVTALAEKNLKLTKKLEVLTKRSTREKLLSYLEQESKRAGAMEFSIPYNREQLAAYLSVDRSAMSSELGRLKAEGILDFKKNHFLLKIPSSKE